MRLPIDSKQTWDKNRHLRSCGTPPGFKYFQKSSFMHPPQLQACWRSHISYAFKRERLCAMRANELNNWPDLVPHLVCGRAESVHCHPPERLSSTTRPWRGRRLPSGWRSWNRRKGVWYYYGDQCNQIGRFDNILEYFLRFTFNQHWPT